MKSDVYYLLNGYKILMVVYNLAVLAAGLWFGNDLVLSGLLFMSLIGVQFHFTVFEHMQDRNPLNRVDLFLAIGTLVILFVKFFIVTAVLHK